MSGSRWTRREMLRAAAAASLPVFIPARVLGRDGGTPASETVRVGVIGCGGRAGIANETRAIKGMQVVAVCDCLLPRAEEFARKNAGPDHWTGPRRLALQTE